MYSKHPKIKGGAFKCIALKPWALVKESTLPHGSYQL